MENLTRGIVAVKPASGREGAVYVGWRLFGADPETLAFNLYRVSGGGPPVKTNEQPITGATNFVDRGADANQPLEYFVRPVLDGKELAPSRPAPAWDKNYLEIPIQPISGYRPGDASIADLDFGGLDHLGPACEFFPDVRRELVRRAADWNNGLVYQAIRDLG